MKNIIAAICGLYVSDRQLGELITKMQNNRHNMSPVGRARFDRIMRKAFL